MGYLLIGIGILLVIIGPLLLVPVVWLLYRFVLWPVLRRMTPRTLSPGNARFLALVLSVLIVAGALGLSYLPGRLKYDALCEQHARPVITEQVSTSGFYRSKMFPYEAGQYLIQGNFEYVEAPDPYERGVHVRYSKTAENTIHEETVEGITSAYGVRRTFSELAGDLTLTGKVIYEIETGGELARAASVHYSGGPLSLFLGTYGSSSCPDVCTQEGSRWFGTFYNLESIVLGGQPLPK